MGLRECKAMRNHCVFEIGCPEKSNYFVITLNDFNYCNNNYSVVDDGTKVFVILVNEESLFKLWIIIKATITQGCGLKRQVKKYTISNYNSRYEQHTSIWGCVYHLCSEDDDTRQGDLQELIQSSHLFVTQHLDIINLQFHSQRGNNRPPN